MDPVDGKMHKKTIQELKKELVRCVGLLLPQEDFTPANEKVSIVKQFWFLLKPHKYVFLQSSKKESGFIFYFCL